MSATVWSRCRSTNFAAWSPASTNQTGALGGTSPAAEPVTESHDGPDVRDEARTLVVVPETSADRTPEPEVRVPTARDREQVDVHVLLVAIGVPDVDAFQMVLAARLHDDLTRARVDRPDHVDAGIPEDVSDREARLVRREHRGAFARPDAEALDVVGGGSGQHDAGQIVPGERDRSFERARREHHALGTDVPHDILAIRKEDLLAFVAVDDGPGPRPGRAT